METGFLRRGCPRASTVGERRRLFGDREHRPAAQARIGGRDDSTHQLLQMPGHPRDGIVGEEVRAVFDHGV